MKARGRSALAKPSVPLVWRYGRDLTEDAGRGRLDPVIGREEELTRLIQILAARGYDPDYGARPLWRVIQRELSDRLAVLLLDGTFQAGDTVQIGVAEDRLKFR
jgi:ATP-dependent Clp protease ATP-binding subunit ClpA